MIILCYIIFAYTTDYSMVYSARSPGAPGSVGDAGVPVPPGGNIISSAIVHISIIVIHTIIIIIIIITMMTFSMIIIIIIIISSSYIHGIINSGGRFCTLIGVPWPGVSFGTLSMGRFVLKQYGGNMAVVSP